MLDDDDGNAARQRSLDEMRDSALGDRLHRGQVAPAVSLHRLANAAVARQEHPRVDPEPPQRRRKRGADVSQAARLDQRCAFRSHEENGRRVLGCGHGLPRRARGYAK